MESRREKCLSIIILCMQQQVLLTRYGIRRAMAWEFIYLKKRAGTLLTGNIIRKLIHYGTTLPLPSGRQIKPFGQDHLEEDCCTLKQISLSKYLSKISWRLRLPIL